MASVPALIETIPKKRRDKNQTDKTPRTYNLLLQSFLDVPEPSNFCRQRRLFLLEFLELEPDRVVASRSLFDPRDISGFLISVRVFHPVGYYKESEAGRVGEQARNDEFEFGYHHRNEQQFDMVLLCRWT